MIIMQLVSLKESTVARFNNEVRFRRFNSLIFLQVLGRPDNGADRTKNRNTFALAVCDCGNLVTTTVSHVKSGSTTSCGCKGKEKAIKSNTKHGLRKHPTYGVWRGIRERCNRSSNSSFKDYGGRGIKVCVEWNNDFQPFFEWAIANGYNQGLQIDRIDNNGDYCPDNCRFVTQKVNQNNKRNNRFCMWDGEIISFAECDNRLRKAKGYINQIEIDEAYHRLPSNVQIIPKNMLAP